MKQTPLAGRLVSITGAGSGIGRALAMNLSRAGCRLVISDIDGAALAGTAANLGGLVHQQELDVANRLAVLSHAATISERFGTPDIIINNAGVDVVQPLSGLNYGDFEWLMAVNFWGVVYGTKAHLPQMLRRGSGTIVNVASVLGLYALPAHGAYSASKFAIRGFTEALRHELWDSGVHAQCVYPGAIATDFVRHARFRMDDAGRRDQSAAAAEFDALARTRPDAAAEVIVRGIRKRTPRIIIGGDARFVDRLQRLMPSNYYRVIRRLAPLVRHAAARKVAAANRSVPL